MKESSVFEVNNLLDYIDCVKNFVAEKNIKPTKTSINKVIYKIETLENELNKLNMDKTQSQDDYFNLYLSNKKINDLKTEIDSWKQVRKALKSYSNLDSVGLNLWNYRFFYRGHYNADKYKLIPSVFRGNDLIKEDFYYHSIKVQCSESFVNCNHINQLAQMQHYNCPTRLLDITSNPLVALYFACKNFHCNNCDHSEKGEIFVFAVKESDILYYDSDRALMLSCIPRFTYADKTDMYKACYDKIRTGKIFDSSNNVQVIERLYHEIRTEVPSFDKKMQPIDLLTPRFVQPLKMNARILKQDGAFIISGLSNNNVEAEKKLLDLVDIRIKVTNQEQIIDELDSIGVNEASLFPEVDKVADYLKSKK